MIGTITYILARAGWRAMNGTIADERRRLAGAESPAAYVSYDPRLLAGVGWYGYRIAFKGGDRQLIERARYMLSERYSIRDSYDYYADGVYVIGVLLRQRVHHYGIGGGSISHEDDWYGVEIDTTVLNPALLRIGKEKLHRDLPIQSGMRRCLLLDDGTVNYYLDANDSTLKEDGTPAILDGTDGQVMVEIPEHYCRIEAGGLFGTKQRVKFSIYPLDGFTRVPKSYISAFEAALDRTNNKLSSVINTTAQYRGGTNDSSWDNTYRSQLGMPATNISLTNFRTYASNRGTRWTCQDINIYTQVCMLYLVEYANRDIQASFTSTLTAEGYHQGGLGNGVSNMSNWNTYNSYGSIVPCGVTVSLGNATGVVTYNVIDSDGTTVKYAAPVPSYRGIENLFGHLWKHTDGILVNIDATTTSDVYVCADNTKFSSTLTEDYLKVGEEARSSEWTKNVMFPYLIATEVGADSSTGWCDYHYTSLPSSGSSLRCVLFGGNASDGSDAGFAYAHSNFAPSNAHTTVGSRLCYRA